MTDDIRTRLRDLAEEMPPLHAPPNLETRARRHELGTAAAIVGAVLVVVLGVWGVMRAIQRSQETVPAGVVFPTTAPTPARQALLQAPEGLYFDTSGDLFISEWYGNHVDMLAPNGSFGVIAGTGAPGYAGDGGPATAAEIDSPTAMAIEPDGNMLFVDNNNNCIRRIDRQGLITRVAGVCGMSGLSGDGGPALDAKMSRPLGLVLDSAGGFFFSDNDHGLVRHVDAAGTITTIAGNGKISPFDAGPRGVPASSLNLGRTGYLLRDPKGNLYVTDLGLNIVVRIDPSGIGTVIAGTGVAGYSGDGGPATRARLNFPDGLAMDSKGDLFFSDTDNNVIRMIDTHGIIHTVAGDGRPGLSGDGGPATKARLAAPAGLAIDESGNLYIADQQNDLVRRVDTAGIITVVAGKIS